MKKGKLRQTKQYFFELTQSKKGFNSYKRIEEIILLYNILIELYVMINKIGLILYPDVPKYQQESNLFHSYLELELTNKEYPYQCLVVSNRNLNGAWPSGKATGFGPAIRRFESFRPRTYSFFIYQNTDIKIKIALFFFNNLLFFLRVKYWRKCDSCV